MALYRLYKARWDATLPPSARAGGQVASKSQAPSSAAESSLGVKRKASTLAGDSDESDDELADNGKGKAPQTGEPPTASAKKKRKGQGEGESFPGGGRRGVSSGLSTIVRNGKGGSEGRKGSIAVTSGQGGDWWKSLDKKSTTAVRVKSKGRP